MKLRNSVVAALLALVIVIIVASGLFFAHHNRATHDTSSCRITPLGTKNTAGTTDSRFVLNKDGTVTTDFEVTGVHCKQAVSLTSWQAPNATDGKPYDQQKVYKSNTGTFSAGQHSLTIQVPDCYYQVDLVRGSDPTGDNGSAQYSSGVFVGSLHGGSQACGDVLPSTGASTNILWGAAATAVLGTFWFHRRQIRALQEVE